MIRRVLAVLLGLIAGGVFNMALVTVSQAVYPLPEGVDPNDFEAFRAHVQAHGLPTGSLMMVLAAHIGGSFVSGFVCGAIAMRPRYLAAAILGVFWACGGVAMLMMLPSPIWFAAADVLLYVPGALLGAKLGGALTGGSASRLASPGN
jgi:hypothetical protein